MNPAPDTVNPKFDPFAQPLRWILFLIPLATIVSLAAALVDFGHYADIWIEVAIALLLLSIVFGVFVGRASLREMRRKSFDAERHRRAHRQVEELFAMTDMLQAADNHADAAAILKATAQRLIPEFSGALYIFNNSRDRLDLADSWNLGEARAHPDFLVPGNCWAMKRGKPHINATQDHTLCCNHEYPQAATLELPMIAQGQIHGLLMVGCDSDGAFDRLIDVRRTGRALADSLSLALSNIALREKLRTQSLRDPLTGLYNRRYMEDALERYCSLSDRSGTSIALLMIDLDNFKRLNDDHGHARGDSVLRDVATQMVGTLRPADVVSRYGGEELVVILPNCDLADAVVKAELLRARIEGLSDAHGVPISASFGVAAIPETANGSHDLIPLADSALYQAKQRGKNCVVTADRRAGGDAKHPRLAVG